MSATIVAAKVRGAWAAWRPLGELLAAAVVARAPAVDAVTWVPATAVARRERGFDHAALLARPVAQALGAPLVATLRASPRHVDRGASVVSGRRALPDDAFVATRRDPDVRLLVVDDVLTTGATAAAAARAVRAAGARSVAIAVLARAGDRSLSE